MTLQRHPNEAFSFPHIPLTPELLADDVCKRNFAAERVAKEIDLGALRERLGHAAQVEVERRILAEPDGRSPFVALDPTPDVIAEGR